MFEKYQNPEIQKQIDEKGFAVYTYIDPRELFLSIKKDYIHQISLLYWVFLWIFIIAGMIFWQTGGANLVYVWVFGILYGYIFLRIIITLYGRTKLFLKNTSIIYTRHALMLNKKVYTNDTDPVFLEQVEKLEEVFHESPGGESLLFLKTKEMENSLFDKVKTSFSKTPRWNSKWAGQILLLIALYNIVFLGIYYLGYILFFGVFLLYAGIVSVLMRLDSSPEHRINAYVLTIQKHIDGMNQARMTIEHASGQFLKRENINISGNVEKYFPPFYRHMELSLAEKTKLLTLIETSDFSEIIDVQVLNGYLKNQFNTPLQLMIDILAHTHAKLETELQNTHNLLGNADSEYSLSGNLELKLRTLEHQDNLILSHITQLKQSLL